LRLPALRERHDDIPLLLAHYLQKFAKENGVAAPRLSPATVKTLSDYAWPGNIRELRNAAENLVVLHPGKDIQPNDLDLRLRQIAGASAATLPTALSPAHLLDRGENEKRLLKEALAQAQGNRTKAAELMGISRRTLHRKLVQWPELDTGTHD
jgi:DNA-binding NtrC family response regulator